MNFAPYIPMAKAMGFTALLIKAFCTSATGYAGAGGLSVMLDPDTGKPLTYTRYMEMYSTLNS